LIEPRQNGKGSVLEARVLAGMFLFGERLILWSAHEFKTASEAFQRVKSLIESTPSLNSRVKSIRTAAGQEGIELHNGSRLRFVARSKGSGRGFSPDLVILDEAYALTDEQIAALMPALSARPNAQVLYTSSAPLPDSLVLKRVCVRGRKGSAGLAYFEWCADWDDDPEIESTWVKANPAYGRRIFAAAIQRELSAMPLEEFARERLGLWREEDVESVIDMNLWRQLADRTPRPEDLPRAFALDMSPDRHSISLSVAELVREDRVHLEIVEQFSRPDGVMQRVKELKDRWNPCAFILDPAGPVGSLLPDFEPLGIVIEPTKRRHTRLELITARTLGQACGAWYDDTINGRITHSDQPSLNAALQGAARRPLVDAWAWTRKDSAVDISPIVSVTLAHHALRLYGSLKKPSRPKFVSL
jgi:hypothetical protein